MQASTETKARVLPWLSAAIDRTGPSAGVDEPCRERLPLTEGGPNGPGLFGEGRKGLVGKGPYVRNGCATDDPCKANNEEEGYDDDDDEDDEDVANERDLCRLVQAASAAGAGAG